jgi:hypothetical protein
MAFVGPGLPLLGLALGSAFAIACTDPIAHFVFDRCRVAEATPAVRSAPLHSTVHGPSAGRD